MNKKRIALEEDQVNKIIRAREIGREEARMEIDAANNKAEAARSIFEAAGKIKASQFYKSQAEFFSLIILKKVKDSREYYEKYGMTWAQFCEHCGIKRRTVDEHLQDLKPFRDEWLADFRHFLDCDIHKIKYLGMAVIGGAANIEDDGILYGEEKIPLTKADIASLLDRLEIAYKDQIKEQKKQSDKEIKALQGQIEEADKDNKLYKKEIDRLSVLEPKKKDRRWAEDHLKKISELFQQADFALRAIAFDERIWEDPKLQGEIAGLNEALEKRFFEFRRDFNIAITEQYGE